MINESRLLTPENLECQIRSLEMPGARILDVCAVQASYGHLLVLRTDGEICGMNLDSGVITRLCLVELPDLPSEKDMAISVHPRCGCTQTPAELIVPLSLTRGEKEFSSIRHPVR